LLKFKALTQQIYLITSQISPVRCAEGYDTNSALDSFENSFQALVEQERTELDSDNDSELLVLASSQFNSMEGVEMGGGGGGGVQLGGDSEIKVSRYGRVLKKKA
jgi:hypothetical protein